MAVETYKNEEKQDEIITVTPTQPREDFGGKVKNELTGGVFSDNTTRKPKVAGLDEILIYKTDDESITSSSTLQNDEHLTFPVEANNNYLVHMFIKFLSPAAADIKFFLSTPSGTTYDALIAVLGATNIRNVDESAAFELEAADATDRVFTLTGVIKVGSVSGVVNLQWAQATINAGITTVYNGSWMKYQTLLTI